MTTCKRAVPVALLFAITLAAGSAPGPLRAQTPLDPNLVPKFATQLPLPGALDGTATSAATPIVITMSEFQQQILPAALYPPAFAAGTYVWGYNGSYPGPTIVAQRGIPTHVRYVNNLFNPGGGPLYLQNTIKVDQTIHWADPLGQGHSNEPYLGPVPACVHLHGGEVPSAFDGGPDAWWTPGHVQQGPGYVTDQYAYPNDQQATTMFYHDHALGMTRTNVYSGLAGFYLLKDPLGEAATLPGGAGDPAADQYGNPYEVGLAFQDRMFDTNGQLYFPAVGLNPEHPFWMPEFFGNVILVNGKPWPYMNVEPRRYRFHFLNGSNARFYELAFADENNMPGGPPMWQIGTDGGLLDAPVRVSDPLDPASVKLIMAPGERADIIIDFSGFEGRTFTITNDANEPFPDGEEVDPANTGLIMQFRIGNMVTGGSDPSFDPAVNTALRTDPIERPAIPLITRALTLNENMAEGGPMAMFVNNTMWDMAPTEQMVVGSTEVWEIINLTADTHPMHMHLFQFQLINRQDFNVDGYESVYGMPMEGMGPPMNYNDSIAATGFKRGGNPDVTPFLIGSPTGPDPNENGWKDTFRMNPDQVTRILVRAAPQDAEARAAMMMAPSVVLPGMNLFPFDPWVGMGNTDSFGYPGGPGYVWHCHIIDHEDNEMMRPLMLLPEPVVPTLLVRFEATATDEGLKISWELTDPDNIAAVNLERASAEQGPWTRLTGDRTVEGRTTAMLDASVEAGQTYWYRLEAVLRDGTHMTLGPVKGEANMYGSFALRAVSPNPANGPIRVDFTVARPADVRLAIHDIQGREVAVLAEGLHGAGLYTALWDGVSGGNKVAAGIYFLNYRTPEGVFNKRVVIAR